MIRRQDPGRCPRCRERVTPFAAGCALCGADLDVRRWDAGPSLGQRAGSAFSALWMGPSRWRPRATSSPIVDLGLSCMVVGLVLSVLGVVAYGVALLLTG